MTGTLRQAVIERLRSPTRYPQSRFEGRGIVICAGGLRYFVCVWVLVAVLRRVHRVDLPIQVWHLGRGEMSEEMRLLLEGLKVEMVDAEAVVARFPARIAGGWPLKPYAILHSRFREVLYLDADTVPLVDLSSIFDWELYRGSGMVMWPDIVDLKAASPIWRTLDLEPRDHVSVEAGILLVDKDRAGDVLDLAVLLNEHAEEVYAAVYGDKDTFLLASLLLGRTPTLVPHRPFIFDVDLVQRDPWGDPLLQHRTGAKWNLNEPNRALASAELMPHCTQALAELRERWSGVVFNAPQRTQQALAEEAQLVAVRDFLYIPQGAEGRKFELLPAGRVGEGRGDFEQHWAIIERNGLPILQFYSSTRLTVELNRCADGSWQGFCLMPVGFQAQRIEMSAHRTWPNVEARPIKSAAELVSALLDSSLFAAGFDAERGHKLRAALTLINDCFDDVPEQIDARLAALVVAQQWCDALAQTVAELRASRNERSALTVRSDYPKVFDDKHYERIL
jgi:hypothetical protein